MRSSLLINCSTDEAQEVRKKAGLQRRTVSAYFLYNVMRFVELNERATRKIHGLSLSRLARVRVIHPRTTLHIYCSAPEGARIRLAAQRKGTTISGFTLACLHHWWEAEEQMVKNKYWSKPLD